MELKIIKNIEIKSVEQWGQIAPPMNPNQWKDGRSAKLLARLMTDKVRSGQLMESLFNSLGYDTTGTVICEPEAVTSLPGAGNGRNHDLLMVGKDFVAGIEAKVDEPFGKTISQQYKDATENKKNRIEKMMDETFHDTNPDECSFRYQLLTGIIATVDEAKYKGKKKALFLVIVFPDYVIDKSRALQNRKDYEAFCKSLGLASNGGIYNYKNENSNIELTIKWIEVKSKVEIKEI